MRGTGLRICHKCPLQRFHSVRAHDTPLCELLCEQPGHMLVPVGLRHCVPVLLLLPADHGHADHAFVLSCEAGRWWTELVTAWQGRRRWSGKGPRTHKLEQGCKTFIARTARRTSGTCFTTATKLEQNLRVFQGAEIV